MWVVAFLGMSTAFIESTLGQIFKVRWHDGTFRGGPAYWMQRALGTRTMGLVFAVLLVFTYGIAFNMVQANTIANTVQGAHGVPTWISAIVLLVITAPIVLRGIKRVARITEWMAPLMALAYVLLALVIVITRIGDVPEALGMIIRGAFGLDQALAGTAGGMLAAILNGTRRGLFSNEAGMGSAPNTAATSTVKHPVEQGFIQSIAVFVDTMLVCSATAIIILLAGPEVYTPGETGDAVGATLTQTAVAAELGGWTAPLMTLIIFTLAYSSVLGNYTYAEINTDFLSGTRGATLALRLAVIASVGIGSIAALSFVWLLADIAMGLMAVTNLVSVFILGRWAIGALRDWEAQRKDGVAEPGFLGRGNPLLPTDVPGDIWVDPTTTPLPTTGDSFDPHAFRAERHRLRRER